MILSTLPCVFESCVEILRLVCQFFLLPAGVLEEWRFRSARLFNSGTIVIVKILSRCISKYQSLNGNMKSRKCTSPEICRFQWLGEWSYSKLFASWNTIGKSTMASCHIFFCRCPCPPHIYSAVARDEEHQPQFPGVRHNICIHALADLRLRLRMEPSDIPAFLRHKQHCISLICIYKPTSSAPIAHEKATCI